MRAFIAIGVPAEIRDKIEVLGADLPAEGIKPVEKENLHITLRFLGEIDEGKVAAIKDVISSLKFESFTANCVGTGVFPSEKYVRIVWVGVESDGALERIAEELNGKLEVLGFKKESFTSHLTIARVRRKVDLGDFLSKHKNYFLGQFTISPGDVKLKKSTLTPKGPIYEDV